ncbi:MAG: hypothetical protein WAM39_29015 [Bryobacteraceae bacterium]
MQVAASRIALLVLLGCALPIPVHADGGAVQFRQRSGPFIITLFSSPVPLRTGESDLSVLVESAVGNQPVLDASVKIELSQPGFRLRMDATHVQASNKLLYAALPEIPKPGNWTTIVSVTQGDSKIEVRGTVNVISGPPALVSYWPYFAIVPCMVGLFVLNQILKSKALRSKNT